VFVFAGSAGLGDSESFAATAARAKRQMSVSARLYVNRNSRVTRWTSGVLLTEILAWTGLSLSPDRPGRQRSIFAIFSQDFPQFRCQALVFVRVALLHCSQVSDHLFRSIRSLTRLDRLDVIPQLSELPDRPGAE
jgi:hypothetical protein